MQRLYSLAGLSAVTGVSLYTLRKWKNAGWLKGRAKIGNNRYTEADYNRACTLSLQDGSQMENDPSVYDRIAQGYL